ncbi:MAG: FtsX-like permease family protein, partial [Ginsengibacter sp.]
IKGIAHTALADIHSIVITEQLAKKIFGNENPMNKIILADNADNFTVTGVLKDLPYNTQFKFEYLLPWDFLKASGEEHAAWDYNYVNTYAELQTAANIIAVNSKISDVIKRNSNEKAKSQIFLYPLTKEHLYGRFENGKPAGGNIDTVRMMSILAIVILLIACINFMNLSTARSIRRAKEVGIRKVIGAVKRSLVFQFITESVLLAFISGIIALIIVQLLLPVFSSLAHVHLVIGWQSVSFWLMAMGFILFTGILAGSYPAFYLSSFKPVKVLKGVLKNGNALVTPRKVLVVLQFVFSVFLINLTIVVQKQINHEQKREIGFVKDNLIFHPLTDDLSKNFDLVKNDLINTGAAIAVCKSNTPVTRSAGSVTGLKWKGQDITSNESFEQMTTSGDFIKTNGLQLVAGRDIDIANFPTDTASCLINETALKVTGFKNPVGELIDGSTIVGVVKDFLIGNTAQATRPVIIKGGNWGNFINIRLSSNYSSVQNLKKAESILKKYNPGFITEYQFADDDYAAKFRSAKQAASLIKSFTLVAIFISCLGLFALASYMAENRIKEIGIRKVLGASVAGISSLMAKEFIKLVIVAIIIASPLAWMFMKFFLQHFEYRTSISIWILISAGAAVLLIAVFTISSQSIKAAIANPARSLRME